MLDGLADYHIHTRYSVDCDTEMEAACQAAMRAGLTEVAFCDHLDFGPDSSPHYFRPDDYFADLERVRSRFAGQLVVRAGIEAGEPHLYADDAAKVISAWPFDYVIGSAHYAASLAPAWRASYFERPIHPACEDYFTQVVALARDGDFDCLGHLDVVKRDCRRFGHPYPGDAAFADQIRAALAALVERGRGLEINTSPLHRGQTETCPSLQVLSWFRELGGQIVTLGSDAHTLDGVGAYLDVATDQARRAGFDRLARFAGREVQWARI